MSATNVSPIPLTMPTGVIAPVGNDRARRMAWADVQRTEINQKVGPTTDPTNSHWLHKFDLSKQFDLFYGVVVDAVAYANCYRVQVERGRGTIWCSSLANTGLQPMGARQLAQIPIGAPVILAMHPGENTGVIIGVIPTPSTDGSKAMVDSISQQGRSGLLVDDAHNYPLSFPDNGLITDWSAGRPFDATTAGEVGNITDTGLLQFLDSFMQANRVDEETGVWAFYHDQLLRVGGHNLQLWSTGSEREDLDDQGEFQSVHGYTPYFWEALGAFEYETRVHREIDPKCWQKESDSQHLTQYEPCQDDQVAFYRLRDFYGYLGQAHKRVLSLPPQSNSGPQAFDDDEDVGPQGPQCVVDTCGPQDINLLPRRTIYPGVYEENLALTGRKVIRTAHEYIISKHVLIPSPKQIARPEDPEGDRTSNYKAAGKLGDGQDHKIAGELEVRGPQDDHTQIRTAGFLDNHAYSFNWVGNHPFHYHELDWYLPDEADLDYLDEGSQGSQAFAPPQFGALRCNQFLPAPEAIPVKVDHRYGDVNYYPNHSYFGLLADGGIVIGCGFGAEIKLANGHIWLTAPGDINLQTGRTLTTFAGYDIVLRAKNSIDVSSTNKDVRVKANKNLWLAATGCDGGILLESKATGVYCDADVEKGEDATMLGITLKANNSQITVNGAHTNFTVSENTESTPTLTFDVGYSGRLRFRSKFFERFMHVDGAALDFWATPGDLDSPGVVNKGAEWWADGAVFNAPLVINDRLLVTKDGTFKDQVSVLNGHVATSVAREVRTNGKVGALDKNALDRFNTVIDDFVQRADETLPQAGNRELDNLQRQREFGCVDAEFSFRTVKQYRTEDYVLFESRWQQLARLGDVDVKVWKEEGVNDTFPYPGKENFDGEAFRTLDLRLYDVNTGRAGNRGEAYEEPAYEEPVKKPLNDNYLVII